MVFALLELKIESWESIGLAKTVCSDFPIRSNRKTRMNY